MLLSVFSGIAMFGFFGIILGPVLMIVIVTTISVYLAVYKGVEMEKAGADDNPDERKKLFRRKRSKAKAVEAAAGDTVPDSVKPAAP